MDHAPLRGHTGTIPGARKHRSDGVESLAYGRTLVAALGARSEDSAATGVGGNQGDNTAYESGAVYIFGQ